MHIEGKCHCGNIAFDLDWPDASPRIPARACDCSFCAKHGGVRTSNPLAKLRVAVRDKRKVSAYARGTRTAEFKGCSSYGVVPVVNVNALAGVDPALLDRAAASFEAEAMESRLARRKRNWIANVQLVDQDD